MHNLPGETSSQGPGDRAKPSDKDGGRADPLQHEDSRGGDKEADGVREGDDRAGHLGEHPHIRRDKEGGQPKEGGGGRVGVGIFLRV